MGSGEKPSNQVSNYQHHQLWTPTDTTGPQFPGQDIAALTGQIVTWLRVAIQPEWRHAGSAAGFGSRDVGACSSRVGVRVAGICGAGCILVVVTGVRLRAGARVGR